MAALTQEQINLINEIRRLAKLGREGKLDYYGSIRFGELKVQADIRNLCWW